jgi:hypothetical protein
MSAVKGRAGTSEARTLLPGLGIALGGEADISAPRSNVR